MRPVVITITICITIAVGAAGCAKKNAVQPRHAGTENAPLRVAVAAGASQPAPAPPAAPKPEPGIRGAAGQVSFAMVPQFETLLAGSDNTLHLLLSMSGKSLATPKRQPIDLAVVIDRSSSMTGDKIVSVKTAALELLKSLKPDDRITLISYSDNVRVHLTGLPADRAGIERLRSEILSIQAYGNTALGPATFEALSQLERSRGDAAAKGRISHVMLLSDGLANRGVSDPRLIGERAAAAFEKGVSLSTLGVGLDYNEDLMTLLADQGGGQYHFIREDTQIAAVLQEELNGLMAQVAREMVLTVRPAKGVSVETVYGYPMVVHQDRVVVKIGALRANQNRDIVIRASLTAPMAEPVEVAAFDLAFNDIVSHSAKKWAGDIVLPAGDTAAHKASEVSEVVVRVAEVESAREMEVAARAVDQGDFQQAQVVIDNNIDVLEKQAKATPSRKLNRQINAMKRAKSDLNQAKSSISARKTYVKSKKAAAYKQSKRSRKASRKPSTKPAKKKTSNLPNSLMW